MDKFMGDVDSVAHSDACADEKQNLVQSGKRCSSRSKQVENIEHLDKICENC